MNKNMIVRLNQTFDGLAFTQDGFEYWMARDLITRFEKKIQSTLAKIWGEK